MKRGGGSAAFASVRVDGEGDAFHGGAVLEGAHGSGVSSDLPEASFDGVCGPHPLPPVGRGVSGSGRGSRRGRRTGIRQPSDKDRSPTVNGPSTPAEAAPTRPWKYPAPSPTRRVGHCLSASCVTGNASNRQRHQHTPIPTHTPVRTPHFRRHPGTPRTRNHCRKHAVEMRRRTPCGIRLMCLPHGVPPYRTASARSGCPDPPTGGADATKGLTPQEKHRIRRRTDPAHRASTVTPGSFTRRRRAPTTHKPYVTFKMSHPTT